MLCFVRSRVLLEIEEIRQTCDAPGPFDDPELQLHPTEPQQKQETLSQILSGLRVSADKHGRAEVSGLSLLQHINTTHASLDVNGCLAVVNEDIKVKKLAHYA